MSLERYSRTDCERSTIEASSDVVAATLRRIANDWSSTLYMHSGDGDTDLQTRDGARVPEFVDDGNPHAPEDTPF